MAEIGLEPAIDGIGNVYGRHKGPGPHLLVGSHIETQNQAGWLDGALGVVAGLALARAGLPVDVVAFADEEGHFEGGFLGSRSILGLLPEDEIDRSRNRTDGTPLRDALAAAGLAGKPRMQLEPGRHKGFFEMHIEQGTQLERAGLRVGVVTGIVAIWQWRITIEGMQDHAGGTTMAERRDAGLAAVRLLAMIDAGIPEGLRRAQHLDLAAASRSSPARRASSPARPTSCSSSATSTWRCWSGWSGACAPACRRATGGSAATATLANISKSLPAPCDAGDDGGAGRGGREAWRPAVWQRMPSGAGHDAQYMARAMPVAMLFTPSIGGISHHWAEDTKEEDLALCCRILGDAAGRFLAGLTARRTDHPVRQG